MAITPVDPISGGTTSNTQSSSRGDDFSTATVAALTWSQSDSGVTQSIVTDPCTALKTLTAGGATDHSDWYGLFEPVVVAADAIIEFEVRFMLDDATNSEFLLGLVAGAAPRTLVTDGFFVTCASGTAVLTGNAAVAAATTADYVHAPGGSVIDGQWHTLTIVIHTGPDNIPTAEFWLDGRKTAYVAPTTAPTAALRVFMGMKGGTATVKTRYVDWISRSVGIAEG